MKTKTKKVIPYLIVIVPLVLVLTVSFVMISFYLKKVTTYSNFAKERSIKEYIDTQKAQGEMWLKHLKMISEYKNKALALEIKDELKAKLERAKKITKLIYDHRLKKYKKQDIKIKINYMINDLSYSDIYSDIFINDFNSNTIIKVKKSQKISLLEDISNRSLKLEELQKVRKYKSGFVEVMLDDSTKQIVYVEDLGIENWYIGIGAIVTKNSECIKSKLLEMISAIPVKKSDFLSVYESGNEIFSSQVEYKIPKLNFSKKAKWYKDENSGYYYLSEYYEDLDWHFVYGFSINKMSFKAFQELKGVEQAIDKEFEFIVASSALIVLFVTMLSLLLSRKLNKIFKEYQDEVDLTTLKLVNINEALEQRIESGITLQREKDKILIQQSKMAEMGDMLSMIAHQWRQPLNQMSYLLMNLDGAYEDNKLTKKYLDSKLKEGNELLEFMSSTIDDFRNYFRPNRDKELVQISKVIESAVSLIIKPLELENIALKIDSISDTEILLYKNEFIQVLLNLIKNAKDILVQNSIENKHIRIKYSFENSVLLVTICDNGGGIDEKIIDKIFEPYFSTKDKTSGTGLGLYMSKMIIEEHLDGELNVYNLDDGACFEIKLR